MNMHLRPALAEGWPNPLLEVRDLSKRFVQRQPLSRVKHTVEALNGVNLKIRPGTTLAIVGESGSGKSTLARCLALLETPTHGQIILGDRDLLALNRRELPLFRRGIQLIFQDPTSALNPRLTAVEIIAEPLAIPRIGGSRERRRRALKVMDRVGLPAQWADKHPLEFSGGQRQRIAIARALILEPSLLILDEALSSLDIANQQSILALLARLRASRSLTCVHIAHDLRLVAEVAHEIAVMHAGRIVEHKLARELFSKPKHDCTKTLLAAQRPLEAICAERFEKVLD
jgi:ABC-type glutathione transport system ATPase component